LDQKIICEIHDKLTGGYFGIKKTLSKTRDKYFWHKMSSDVEHHCKNCDKCASRKSPNKLPKAQLHIYNVGAPMESWALEILGSLLS
jgi:hypothetical protein